MRKLGLLRIFLLVLVGIGFLCEPAGALPYCSCNGCAAAPNATCISREDSGFRMPCANYFYDYCTGAPETEKLAAGADFFPTALPGLPVPQGGLTPLPVVKPGC